mgnify:CR=1 FL=1
MAYPTLEKIFHADASSDRYAHHRELAISRLESESTFRTGIELDAGELFLAVPRELSLLNERVLRRERRVSKLWRSLPTAALGAYIRTLILDEVVYSNEIEGVHSTRRDIERALEEAKSTMPAAGGEGRHTPFFEFAKLYLGLTDGPEPPETLQDIRDIYDSVVMDALAEENRLGDSLFRSGQVVVENGFGRVVHVGVSPESRIEEMLTQWLALSRSEEIPETYSALLCHFLFGYIHPFYDGNGRTGRYLLALHLSRPLSQPTVLSLSRVIAENKGAYYRAFDAAEKKLNCGEGTHFVMTMLDLVAEAQMELIADLEEKRQLLDELEARIDARSWIISKRALNVLFYAAQMEVFDAFRETRLADVASWLGVSKPTARKAFDELVAEGLLVKVSQRPPVFRMTDLGKTLLGLEAGK